MEYVFSIKGANFFYISKPFQSSGYRYKNVQEIISSILQIVGN